MSYPAIQPSSDLIEALKLDQENFELSNVILKNHNAMRSVYELYNLRSDLLEFAKDPKVGLEILGPEPKRPSQELLQGMTDDEKNRAMQDYATMVKMYEDRKKAMEMHVPYADFVMIENYLEKYRKTIHVTPAVKGLRFKAFTKDVEHEDKGILGGFFKRSVEQ